MEIQLLLLATLSLCVYAYLAITFVKVSGCKVDWKQSLIIYFFWPIFRPVKFIEFMVFLPYISVEGLDDQPVQHAKH
jgi:hypothetical protein